MTDEAMTVSFRRRLWSNVMRLGVGSVLVVAALSKISDASEFLAVLTAYELPLAMPVLKVTAIVLPWFELVTGLLLIGDVRVLEASVCAVSLFLVFLCVTGLAWTRGLDVSCGCFGNRWVGQAGELPFAGALGSVEAAMVRNALFVAGGIGVLRSALSADGEVHGGGK